MTDMMTDPVERKRLTILTIFLLALISLFSWIISPLLWSRWSIPPFHSGALFSVVCILLFLFVPDCNPFIWSNVLIEEKKNRPRYKIHRNIAIGLSFLIIFAKAAGAYYFNHWPYGPQSYRLNALILTILVFLLGAFGEEILFKAGVFRILLEMKVPRFVSMIVVSVIFALIHFIFIPIHFIVLFCFGMFFMIVFSLYPSIVFVALVHFGFNIAMLA